MTLYYDYIVANLHIVSWHVSQSISLALTQEKIWNWVEISLLTVGLTMTGLTTTLIANDLHWSDSKITTLLTVLVIFVVSLICGAMALLATRLGKPLGFLSFFWI